MRRACLALLLIACSEPPSATPPPAVPARERATRDVKAYVDARVADLVRATEGLCAAAPAPDDDGWSIEADREAVDAMRAFWRQARGAYERVEGAIAILFPQLDLDVDGRYEHVAELDGDPMPFDGHGFIGMHAVERILWSDSHAPAVQAFERALRGYTAPRTPQDAAEATAFRDGLCARLVRDVRGMQQQLEPLALDAPTAWRGILGSVEEQAEKVLLGATGQDESRYASHTLADMRANLDGGRHVLDAYRPLLAEHPEAQAALPEIERRFDALGAAYDATSGDALPPVPEGFDPDAPDGGSPYGRLFGLLATASDPRAEGSLAGTLRRAGLAMDIPPLGR